MKYCRNSKGTVFTVCIFRIDMREMLGRVSKVLDGQPKLIDKFNRLLPPGMPLSHFRQSDAEVFVVVVICVFRRVN